MKRSKTARRWLRKRKRAVKGGLAKLAELAAPKSDSESINPFAQSPAQIQPFDDGILRQDAAAFRLPNALAEAGESDSHSWMPGRFVIFVVIAAIIFISMVAWQVSQMPAK